VAFGGLFLAVGLGIAIPMALGLAETSAGVPQWVGTMAGVLFAVAGLAVIVPGVRDLGLKRRIERLRVHHAREPWVWDHTWDAHGSADDTGRSIRTTLAFTVFVTLFAAIPTGVGFFTPERPLPFRIAAVAMWLMAGGMGWWSAYLIGRRMKYGTTRIAFRRFPFAPGSEVEIAMVSTRQLAVVPELVATLRCVQERYETKRDSRGRKTTEVVSYEVWASEPMRAEVKRGELGWRFAVPATVPGTALSERPPRYWELAVKGEAPGIDYAGVFLVPVYEDQRAVKRVG
jgi:hypothetical protein